MIIHEDDLDKLAEEVRGKQTQMRTSDALDEVLGKHARSLTPTSQLRLRDEILNRLDPDLSRRWDRLATPPSNRTILVDGKIPPRTTRVERSGRDKAAGAGVEDRNEELLKELNHQGVA